VRYLRLVLLLQRRAVAIERQHVHLEPLLLLLCGAAA
jgi:hypothetical protein